MAREIYQLIKDSYRDLFPVLVCESILDTSSRYECVLESEFKDIPNRKKVVLGVGKPKVRSKILNKLQDEENIEFINLIHHTAKIPNDLIMGKGNVFTQSTIFTTDVKIGDFNLFNIASVIAHDANIGNNNVFNPSSSISGNVTIGNNNLLGVRSVVLENLSIGSYNTIGGGAIVTKSIEDGGVYVGVPAKLLKAN